MAKKITKDEIFEKGLLSEVINEAEKAIIVFDKLDVELGKVSKSYKSIIDNSSKNSKVSITELVNASKALNQITEETVRIEKEKIKNDRELEKARIEELRLQKAREKSIDDYNKKLEKQQQLEIKQARIIAEANRPYAKLSATLNQLRKDYKDLAVSGNENTEQAKKLRDEIVELDSKLKQVDATTGQHQRNVGNYTEAVKPLRVQLRELTMELQNMSETDPRFSEMATKAGQLRDKITDTKNVIQATAGSGVENLSKGLAGVGKVGINAFQGVEGALAIFGVESENVMRSLQKLQALAALSDALEGLGGLGDKITEIKASFMAAASQLGIFTTAKKVDIAVTETQVVATEGATIATNTLGKSMKALPIIAIIAGIAGLVAMIYSYVTSNEKAEQSIKKRKEQERLANEESKKAREYIGQESAEFVGLIVQLKNTNQNSKERAYLMSKINSTYGTTLKNIQDETLFQNQLNLAVKDYIESVKARYQIDRNQELINKNLQKQEELKIEIQRKRNSLLQQEIAYESAKKQFGQDAENSNAKQILDATTKSIQGLESELANAEKRLLSYGYSTLSLTEKAEQFNVVTQKETKSIKAKKEAIEKLTLVIAESISYHKEEIKLLEIKRKEIDAGEIQRADDMINARKRTLAEIRVLEAELLGDQKKIDEAKIQQIKDNLEVELDNIELGENEKKRLRLQAELDIKNIIDKSAEYQKQKQKEVLDSAKKMLDQSLDELKKNSELKAEQYDKDIQTQKDFQAQLQAQANAGNITAQQSIAQSIENEKKATLAKEKEQKKQQRIDDMKTLFNLINQNIDKGDNAGIATVKATASMALIKSIAGMFKGFAKGTKWRLGQEDNPLMSGVDGHVVRVDSSEAIVNGGLMNKAEKAGIRSTEQLVNSAIMYQTFNPNSIKMNDDRQVFNASSIEPITQRLESLEQTIKNKTEFRIEPYILHGIHKGLVQIQKDGNLTRKTIIKS